MIIDYLTIKEVAEKWDITPRRVRVLCETGRIEGAAKLGREWAIPENQRDLLIDELHQANTRTGERRKTI